jgi:hypothetical protein
MKELLNIKDYDSFSPLNEMMDGYKQGGMVLILGKKLENGEKRIFACPIKTVIHSPRTKINGKEGSPAKMVILHDDTYRIEMDSSGKFTSHKISGRDKALGILGNKIALNKNKTPYHWISTNYQSVGSLISGMDNILKSIPDIRWKN